MVIRKSKFRKNKSSFKKIKDRVRKVTKSKSIDDKFLQDNEEVLTRMSKSASKYGIFWDNNGNFKNSRADVVGEVNPVTTENKKKMNPALMVLIGGVIAGALAVGTYFIVGKDKILETYRNLTGKEVQVEAVPTNTIVADKTVVDNTASDFNMTAFIDEQLQNFEEAPVKITETISDNAQIVYTKNYATETYDSYIKMSSGLIAF